MQKNMGSLDRAIRIIAGIILMTLGTFKILPYATIIAIFGIFILLTGNGILYPVRATGYFYTQMRQKCSLNA